MTDERLAAVRKVREEADNLRLACIAVAGNASGLLHLAYDTSVSPLPSLDEAILLGRLSGARL